KLKPSKNISLSQRGDSLSLSFPRFRVDIKHFYQALRNPNHGDLKPQLRLKDCWSGLEVEGVIGEDMVEKAIGRDIGDIKKEQENVDSSKEVMFGASSSSISDSSCGSALPRLASIQGMLP
ncbi:hypothetical protein GIB67_031147, partial [Kingdonia uniflora]